MDWSLLLQVAALIAALLGGVLNPPIISLIRKAAHIDGRLAQLVTAVVAVFTAVIVSIVAGTISPEPLTIDYLIALFAVVLTASQAEYRRLKNEADTP